MNSPSITNKLNFTVTVLLTLLLIGCNPPEQSEELGIHTASVASQIIEDIPSASKTYRDNEPQQFLNENMVVESSDIDQIKSTFQAQSNVRKIINNASITIEVTGIQTAIESIKSIADRSGG